MSNGLYTIVYIIPIYFLARCDNNSTWFQGYLSYDTFIFILSVERFGLLVCPWSKLIPTYESGVQASLSLIAGQLWNIIILIYYLKSIARIRWKFYYGIYFVDLTDFWLKYFGVLWLSSEGKSDIFACPLQLKFNSFLLNNFIYICF